MGYLCVFANVPHYHAVWGIELYEKGKVHHVGEFPELEEEMISFSPLTSARSPDRMDALVWALTELAESGSRFILADT